MKKAKSLWLVLALAIMLEVFSVVPVTATNGMMESSFSGQLDETEHVEFERYPDTIPTEIIPQEQIDRLGILVGFPKQKEICRRSCWEMMTAQILSMFFRTL